MPTGRPGGQLTEVLSVRFSKAELADMKQCAEAAGLSLSTWARQACFTAVITESAPQEIPGLALAGWRCAHMHVTGRASAARVSCGAGCRLQPVYKEAA